MSFPYTRSFVSCLLMLSFFNAGQSIAATLYDQLHISREQAGTVMPPFELETLDGTMMQSASLKGRIVLLNFWATWCGPCKDEMPSLGRLSDRFKGQDIQILTITTDLQPEAIKAFLKILALDLPVLLDTTQHVSRNYMARALPLTVVIGKDGKLIGRAMGPREWDSQTAIALIEHLLDEKE